MDLSALWNYFLSISKWLQIFLSNIHIGSIHSTQLQPQNTSIQELRDEYPQLLKVPGILPLNSSIESIVEEEQGSDSNGARFFTFDDAPLMNNPSMPRNASPSMLSIESIILILQHINGLLPFQTDFQQNARRGKRSRMTWRDWLLHSWDLKRRKEWIQRIMNRGIHKRFYLDFLKMSKWKDKIDALYADSFSEQDRALKKQHLLMHDEDSLSDDEEGQHGDSQDSEDNWHLIQDFDRIQYEYLKCCEQFHLHKQRYEFSTYDNNTTKFDSVDQLARAYVYGPLIKDNYYRELNADVFQFYDDDPFQLILTEEERREMNARVQDSMYNPHSKYPKMKVMLMDTVEGRQNRRRAMLSSVKENNGPSPWDVEVERVSNVMGEILNRDHNVTKNQQKPWFYGRFPWLDESREERALRHAQALSPNAYDVPLN